MARLPSTPDRYVQPYRYASPNIPMSAIRRFARQIAERFHPDKIILFGSYAYGTPDKESDVDLLVIMPARDVIAASVRIGLAFERMFVDDLFVRTPRQIERGLRDGDSFLREIMEKGKVLYEARGQTLGSQGRGRSCRSAIVEPSNTAAARSGLFQLPTSRGEIPKGASRRARHRRPENA
jgi:predicted nucleotidyltransferase